MATTSQDIQDLAEEISQHTKHSCFSNSVIIADVLLLLSSQKPEYSEFQFKGKGAFALVLKAVKANSKKPVALKIREFDEDDKKGFEYIQREQNLLKAFTFCKYIVQVNQSFYLTKKKKSKDTEVYFIEEMELCDEDLGQYLLAFKTTRQSIDTDTKILMVIQMLDAINTLHQRNVIHRDIKPQNFLVSEKDSPLPILKLCDLSFSSQLGILSSKSFLSAKGTPGYLSPEAGKNQSRYQSDLYSLGIVIIELDNTSSFDFNAISLNELVELNRGSVFEDHNINRTSILFKLACTFLQPQYQNRLTASQALFMLLKYTKDLKGLQLFSVVTIDQLSSGSKFLPVQSDYQASIAALETHKTSHQSVEEEINVLIAKYKAKYHCSFQITEEQIQSILKILLSSGEFDNCEYLGVGATGLVFGIYNVKHKRHTVLKISLCKNEKDRTEKLSEIDLIRKCQMPYVIRFYGYQFLDDGKGTIFVVEEYERCLCPLSQFLEDSQGLEYVLTEKQKMSMAIQMMDSVNYCHEQSILHRDIKLDNYLVSMNDDGGEITVKLSDFGQSAQFQEDWLTEDEKELIGYELLPPYNCLVNSDKVGSLPFYAPERFHKPTLTTKQTDTFSVGLCITILDNNMTYTERYLCNNYQIFMDKFNNPFKNCEDKINKSSPLFPLILSLLDYSPIKRNQLRSALSQLSQTSELIPKYSISAAYPCNNVKAPMHPSFLSTDRIPKEQYEIFLQQIAKLPNLSNLNLNLENNNLSAAGTEYFVTALTTSSKNMQNLTLNLWNNNLSAECLSHALRTLTNLTNLNLSLWNNKLSAAGTEQLSKALITLTNLQCLRLNLANNNLGGTGTKYLSIALSMLTNLSSLHLDLRENYLHVDYLLKALITINNLSSLNLDLRRNNLSDASMKYISNALSILTNLSNLNLNLADNCNLIPTGMEQLLKSLTTLTNLSNLNLNLRYNILSDAAVEYLSRMLATATNLSTLNLDIGSSSLSDASAEQFFKVLMTLANLSSLNLNLEKNNLKNVEYLSKALITLTSMSSLHLCLQDSSLSDADAECLSQGLIAQTNLSNLHLNLTNNRLSAFGGEHLSKGLMALTNLLNLNLNLRVSNLGADGANHLSNALIAHTFLLSLNLDLGSSKLTDAGAEHLSKGLIALTNLSNLNLNLEDNNLSDAGVEFISMTLKTLTNLSSLHLNVMDNKLSDASAEYVSLGLTESTYLSNLNLNFGNNNLSAIGAEHLSKTLTTLTNLSSLNLYFLNNNLGDAGIEYLSKAITTLSNLSSFYLNLWNNNLNDSGAEVLSKALIALVNLLNLNLNLGKNYNISDTGKEYLKKAFNTLTNLKHLSLST